MSDHPKADNARRADTPERGYCQCGCGAKTSLASQTMTSAGWVKGEPVSFISGHNRKGRLDPAPPVRRNGDIVEIPLTRGGFAIVDADDEELVSGRKWRANNSGYAISGKPAIFLHRLILGTPPTGLLIDHRNGDPLDNRRANLRFVNASLNNFNRQRVDAKSTTGIPGVTKIGKRFRASLSYHERCVYLGLHDTPLEAAHARAAGELAYFGEMCTPTIDALGRLETA